MRCWCWCALMRDGSKAWPSVVGKRPPIMSVAQDHDRDYTRPMAQKVMALAGILGALAVACGAFGAHGLSSRLAGLEDGAKRLEWWHTASHYQLMHALALALVALVAARQSEVWSTTASAAFTIGIVVFCGTLYAMALGAPRWLGAVTPIGGLSLILGWIALAVAGYRALAPLG